MIYQTHPRHGQHMPTTILEAQANEKHGWTTVSEDEFYNRSPAIEGEAVEVDENELSEKEKLFLSYEIKFGKKPPRNIKVDTLKAKLDE